VVDGDEVDMLECALPKLLHGMIQRRELVNYVHGD
jgi:hypothetical protein